MIKFFIVLGSIIHDKIDKTELYLKHKTFIVKISATFNVVNAYI